MGKPDEYKARVRYFLEEVLTFDGDECLYWPFGKNNKGYGIFTIDGRRVVVSREVCLRTHGTPQEGQTDAAHSCGNGQEGCVNPNHLRWATRKENVADKILHGTSNRGVRCAKAKLNEQQLAEILFLKGCKTQKEVGEMYGLHQTTVSKIWLGQRWSYPL